jgi:hypothetical protein
LIGVVIAATGLPAGPTSAVNATDKAGNVYTTFTVGVASVSFTADVGPAGNPVAAITTPINNDKLVALDPIDGTSVDPIPAPGVPVAGIAQTSISITYLHGRSLLYFRVMFRIIPLKSRECCKLSTFYPQTFTLV